MQFTIMSGMRKLNRKMTYSFLLGLLIVPLLAGCNNPEQNLRFLAEDSVDLATSRSGIINVRLGRWTDDVPDDTLLQVDANNHLQVYLITGDQRSVLGSLEQQLPDTPAKTMFLNTGTARFILGWVDESVDGDLKHVLIARALGNEEQRPVSGSSLTGVTGVYDRLFFIPIFRPEEAVLWRALRAFEVFTSESIASRNLTGHRWAVQKSYVPPFGIESYFQRIEVANK